MFEILHRYWNLKPIFNQNWSSVCRQELDPNPSPGNSNIVFKYTSFYIATCRLYLLPRSIATASRLSARPWGWVIVITWLEFFENYFTVSSSLCSLSSVTPTYHKSTPVQRKHPLNFDWNRPKWGMEKWLSIGANYDLRWPWRVRTLLCIAKHVSFGIKDKIWHTITGNNVERKAYGGLRGVPWRGGVKQHWDVEISDFQLHQLWNFQHRYR